MTGIDCLWIEGGSKGVCTGEASARECEDVGDGDEKGWWFNDCVERVRSMKEEEVGNDGVRSGVIYLDQGLPRLGVGVFGTANIAERKMILVIGRKDSVIEGRWA